MADDVTLNAMSGGSVVATDEVSGTGEHVQVVKLAQSADGDRTPIDADSDGIKVKVAWRKNLGTSIYSAGDDALPIAIVDGTGTYSPLTIGLSGGIPVEPGSTATFPISAASPIDVTQSGSWSVTASGTVAATQSGSWQVRPVVGSSVAAGTVTVATTSTQILASSSGRKSVALTNNGTTNVWVGPSGLSLSTGLKIPPGATAVIDAAPAAAIYGIADTSSAAVAYFTESD